MVSFGRTSFLLLVSAGVSSMILTSCSGTDHVPVLDVIGNETIVDSVDFDVSDIGEISDGVSVDGRDISGDADCTPQCEGKDCGDNLCGGSCGDCSGGAVCTESGVCSSRVAYAPSLIDFGHVEMNATELRTFTVTNNTEADVALTEVVVSLGSHPGLKVLDGPSTGSPHVLPPDTFKTYEVEWTATESEAHVGSSLGGVVISTDDVSGTLVIPVSGQVAIPAIEVLPEEIDFGFGAQNLPKVATLTIKNNGYGNLKIQKLEIINPSTTAYGNEIQIVFNPEFPVTSPTSPVESVVVGNSETPVELTFTNKGPDTGEVTATIVITSNSMGQERIEVPIRAKRSGGAVCNAQLVPAITNFGTIATGFPVSMNARLINTGTGACTVTAYHIADCTSDMTGTTCPYQFEGSSSQYFAFAPPPPLTEGALKPGSQASFYIRFTPPTDPDLLTESGRNLALASFAIKDVTSGLEKVIPECGLSCDYNVVGSSGIAKAAVLPDHIDFGPVTIGCYSKTYSVCVYNSGEVPVKINHVEMKGCTTEFQVKNVPALPKTVGTGAPLCFETNYSPMDEGLDECSLHLSVTDQLAPVVVIPLKGEATYETRQNDEFTQVKGDEVDILFVINDSVSMCEEQDRLAASVGEFIARASVWDNDYHIGVISANVFDEAVIGRLNRGDTSVTPRYVTKSGDAQSQFANLVKLGCDGNAGVPAAGLQAVQAALAAPLTTDTGISCSLTSDCTGNPNVCADPANCQYTCIGGSCGGFNKGFLREDARLEIIILSDEEDQGLAAISFYVEFLANIKGWANVDRMHVNAIVGVKGVPAGEGDECVAADGGTASHGYRYIQASEDTGGKYGSICESDFEPIMSDIADITFNPKLQLFLSGLADPATVSVYKDFPEDGADVFYPCNSGWEFDPPSNSVIFDAGGGCVPQPLERIRVSYKLLCLKG